MDYEKKVFNGTYPIFTYKINKSEIAPDSCDELCAYFKALIEKDAIARFIAVFDHYKHTRALGGDIIDQLIDVKNVVFCFGRDVKSVDGVALRPKSFGISEFQDRFVISFLEAPRESAVEKMKSWVEQLLL